MSPEQHAPIIELVDKILVANAGFERKSLVPKRNWIKKWANLAIEKIAKSAKVIGIIDRDKATDDEIKRNAKKGIRTLSRKTIESYLLDDEVLTKLCEDHDASDKIQVLLTAKQDALDKNNLKSSDNLKPIVQSVSKFQY